MTTFVQRITRTYANIAERDADPPINVHHITSLMLFQYKGHVRNIKQMYNLTTPQNNQMQDYLTLVDAAINKEAIILVFKSMMFLGHEVALEYNKHPLVMDEMVEELTRQGVIIPTLRTR